MTSFALEPIEMSHKEQQLISAASKEDQTEPGTSPPLGSVGQDSRGSHSATFSSPVKSLDPHLKPPAKGGRKERTTWGGMEETVRSQASKRQPIRAPGGRGGQRQSEQSRSPRHYQEYIPTEGMYVLYEDQNIRKPRSDGSSAESGSASYLEDFDGDKPRDDTFIGEIDGRYSFSEGHVDDYVRVEVNADTSSTSYELMECKRTVLKPYLIFLKIIGWRRFRESAQDLRRSRLHMCLNVVYPLIIFLMLAITIGTQQVTCFSRTQPAHYRTSNQSNQSHLRIDCTEHLVVTEIIPGLLILAAYLYGIYLFRYGEPEHLAALIETVFLSYSQHMGDSKKRIIGVLRSYLVLGSLWILLDFTLNGVRLYSLQLLDPKSFIPSLSIPPNRPYNSTTLHTMDENVLRFIFVLYSPFGFVFYDLLYFAVVVTYASQSQLIQYYIISIMEKVRTKAYNLEDAIKDIRQTYTYLQVINSKLSTLTTLILFFFLVAILTSVYNLAFFPERDTLQNTPVFYVGVVVGVGNILQWSILAAAPLIQAARLTSRCRQLRRLGLEIGSRPFVYAGTPQLDLEYFMQYTNSTRYTAKLASVPIYPSFVIGFIFLAGIIGCFFISISHNHFVFARWF